MNSTDGTQFSHAAQKCAPCMTNQYILNSNDPKYSCQTCPIGAVCDGSKLKGLVEGSVWEENMDLGIYVLKRCPEVMLYKSSTPCGICARKCACLSRVVVFMGVGRGRVRLIAANRKYRCDISNHKKEGFHRSACMTKSGCAGCAGLIGKDNVGK